MITRTYNPEDVLQATEQYKHKLEDFDVDSWLANHDNIALINEHNDVSLLLRIMPAVVIGHYFYHSRGKDAVRTAKAMREEIFSGDYNVEVIEGLSPLENLGARWLNKQLGFKSYGVVDTTSGPCEVVMLTKDEWRLLNG